MKKMFCLFFGLLTMFLISSAGASPGVAKKAFKIDLCEKVSCDYVAVEAINVEADFAKFASLREYKSPSYNCSHEIAGKVPVPGALLNDPIPLYALKEKDIIFQFTRQISYTFPKYVRDTDRTARVGKRFVMPVDHPLYC